MTDLNPWWIAGACGVVLLVAVAVWLWRLAKAVMAERARELFRLQHERFEEQLLKAAGATGLPRGLTWVRCQITGDATLVRDLTTHGIVALVPVVIYAVKPAAPEWVLPCLVLINIVQGLALGAAQAPARC